MLKKKLIIEYYDDPQYAFIEDEGKRVYTTNRDELFFFIGEALPFIEDNVIKSESIELEEDTKEADKHE